MKKETWFVIVLALVTFFAFNADLPTDIMESRNIVTACEMVTDGNWLVPTMNGELRLEKPPLPTWVGGVIELACPDSLAAQRTAAGIMGLVWTWFLYLFAKLLTRRHHFALLTAMVFLTSYHIVVMGRTATWDIYCHAFMMGGIYLLARGLLADRREQWRWLPAAGLMMGLSFLSKGPVSFYALLLPALISIFAFLRPAAKGKWPAVIVMLVVMVVVSGWWYAYLLVFHADAVDAVVHKESGAWVSHNVRPWYYYWRFFTETGVWAVVMLAALFAPYWKRLLPDGGKSPDGSLDPRRTYLFALTWTLAALVLLSLMPEKKIRYLLPMMAPCALCVACLLEHFENAHDKPSRLLVRINGWLVCVVAAALPVAAIVLKWTTLPLAILLCVLFWAVAAYEVVAACKVRARQMVYGVCALFMLVECFLLKPIGQAFGNPDMHSIGLTRDMPQLRGVPFYHAANDDLRIELVYEAGRKILPLDVTDSAAVSRHAPFALVSHGYAAQTLPANIINNVDTVAIGIFDDNKHPKTDRHYTTDFITHVTLIKGKKVKR